MQIVERLSYAHASAGWCTIVNNMEGMTMAIYIEDAGIAEVFRNGPTSPSPATACRAASRARWMAAT
jgi:hypothetical protein